MRFLVLVAALLVPIAAVAQPAPGAPLVKSRNLGDLPTPATARTNLGLGTISTQSASSIAVTGGTIDGATIGATTPGSGKFTTLNLTGTTGYQIGGLNFGYLIPTTQYQEGLFIGPRAGENMAGPIGYGVVAVGVNALRHQTNTTSESVAVGPYSCEYATTAYAQTCVGEHVIGYDNSNYMTGFGNDAFRDTIGEVGSTGIGAQAIRDGTGSNNTALGFMALQGNSGAIQITGAVTTGDVLQVSFTSTNGSVTGVPATASYTVQGGDTLLSISQALVTAINALTISANNSGFLPASQLSQGMRLGAFLSLNTTNNTGWIALHFPGGNTTGWAITPAFSCTGTCTETGTIYGPRSGTDNIAIGVQALESVGLTTGSYNIGIGDLALGSLYTTGGYNIALGHSAMAGASTDTHNVVIGDYAGLIMAGTTLNVIIGDHAGDALTSGTENTIIGAKNTNGGCVTNQSGVVEIGYGACAPAGNWNMSIMNMIYGINNSGGGGGSMGYIGIGTNNPNATFTVGETNSSNGAHISVKATAKPAVTGCTGCSLDTTASDVAGTLTEGTSQTGFILTWEHAFGTTPHCVVSSPTGHALTSYAATTTTLTVVNASQTSSQYSYVCLQ